MTNKLKMLLALAAKILAWGFGIYVALVLAFILVVGTIALVSGRWEQFWNMLMSV